MKTPSAQKQIPQMRPWFGEEEKNAIHAYLEEDGFMTEYLRTQEFEAMLAGYLKAKHCIVVNNGTISLTAAAIALGIGPADEIIVPNYTMIATPNSVKMLGALPIFVDVEPETLCMNFTLMQKAVTNKTKAIILVSANGRAPKAGISKFEAFSRESGIPLIEDAAQSLGSSYEDQRAMGTVGLIGSFSFSMPKIISTGQGGCLVTNDDALAAKLRRLKDFGRARGGLDIHDTIGYNFKFTELQACLGIEQMKKLPQRVKRKQELYALYKNRLESCTKITLFSQQQTETPWFFDALCENRESLMEYLKQHGVGSRVMYPPINSQLAYQMPGFFPVSEKVGREGIWLPSYTQLSDIDVEYICDKICTFYRSR